MLRRASKVYIYGPMAGLHACVFFIFFSLPARQFFIVGSGRLILHGENSTLPAIGACAFTAFVSTYTPGRHAGSSAADQREQHVGDRAGHHAN